MNTVIITAGGIGKRMGSEIPKQFLLLNGRPVLMHTIERFYSVDPTMQLILTLPLDWQDYWKTICAEYQFNIPHTLIDGGTERYHSVKQALHAAKGDLVAVHDGVRPLVHADTIRACFAATQESGAAIPVIAVQESLRMCSENGSTAVRRDAFRIVQTPQCFKREILIAAYERPFHSGITDDASLVEESGIAIRLVEGNKENIKLTDQADLKIAELFIQNFGNPEVI